jgi:hypothetical protein
MFCLLSEIQSTFNFQRTFLSEYTDKPPIQWALGAIFSGVKRPGRETDHCCLSSAEAKNVWNTSSTHPYVIMVGCLIKQRTVLLLLV